MTTLPDLRRPQSLAPVGRLPRPSGVGGAQNLAAASHQMNGADILRVLRGNWIAISISIVASLIGGFVLNSWLASKHPHYTAIGEIRVSLDVERQTPGELRVVSEPSPANIEIEEHDQAEQIVHPSLHKRLLENSERVRSTKWFNSFISIIDGKPVVDVSAALQDFGNRLQAAPVLDSRLINVSWTYSDPRDCQIIVEELVNQFLKELREARTNKELVRTQMLGEMHEHYESEIKQKSARIVRLSHDLGSGGLSVVGNGSKDFELSALVAEQVHLVDEYNKARQQSDSFDAQVKAGQVPAMVQEMIDRDPSYAQDRRGVEDAEIELGEMEGKLGSTHPLVIQLKKRADNYREKLQTTEAEIRVRYTESIKASLLSAAEAEKFSVDNNAKQIDQLRAQIADLATARNEYEGFVSDVKVLTEKLEKVKQDEETTQAWAPGGGFANADWATQPALPDKPSFPRLPFTLAGALLFGLAVSLGAAFVRELTDSTVRSPRDIARVGQINLLGMIPHDADDPQASGSLPLTIFEAPHSMIAEQFRQVRTRLQHATSLDSTRSILVTACSPGDGATTVACNIAAGLALNGRRILIVDVNFRRPALHEVFKVSNETGLGDVLADPSLFESAVVSTEVPNLSVLVAGNRPSNPTELLESQLLIEIVEHALEEYDHVVFDGAPLLIASETNALAPRLDGVITVVRANGNSRGVLQRLRDQLRQHKAENLGVILNGVRVRGGGYYGPMIKTHYAYGNDVLAK